MSEDLIPYEQRGRTYKALEIVFPEISKEVDRKLRVKTGKCYEIILPFDKEYIDDLIYYNLENSELYDKRAVIAYATRLKEYEDLKKHYKNLKYDDYNDYEAASSVDAILDKTSVFFKSRYSAMKN